jgi:CBS domain-containing protein
VKLADLLLDDWIATPLEASDLQEALRVLFARVYGPGRAHASRVKKLAGDLASGASGEIIRVNEDVVLVAAAEESLEETSVTLGLAKSPFRVGFGGDDPSDTARALLVLLTPRGLPELSAGAIPALVRVLRDPELTRQLLSAGSVVEVRALRELMETELRERFLVSDAMTPARYRIYPDTPLLEVVDLIVRRGLRAVPVVGERFEVLGLISAGDALEHMLPAARAIQSGEPEGKGPTLRARDVMTRSVLCVSDDEPLIEAANMMVNRNVDELPVVRADELVGFLTREAILRILFTGRPES